MVIPEGRGQRVANWVEIESISQWVNFDHVAIVGDAEGRTYEGKPLQTKLTFLDGKVMFLFERFSFSGVGWYVDGTEALGAHDDPQH